jgi:hypothetical protein
LTHFQTHWTETPIAWGADDEENAKALYQGQDHWVFIDIDWDVETLKSMHAADRGLYALQGALLLKAFVQKNNGTAALDVLSDKLRTLYKTFPIANTRIDNIPIGRKQTSGPWNIRQIYIDFTIRSVQDINLI